MACRPCVDFGDKNKKRKKPVTHLLTELLLSLGTHILCVLEPLWWCCGVVPGRCGGELLPSLSLPLLAIPVSILEQCPGCPWSWFSPWTLCPSWNNLLCPSWNSLLCPSWSNLLCPSWSNFLCPPWSSALELGQLVQPLDPGRQMKGIIWAPTNAPGICENCSLLMSLGTEQQEILRKVGFQWG